MVCLRLSGVRPVRRPGSHRGRLYAPTPGPVNTLPSRPWNLPPLGAIFGTLRGLAFAGLLRFRVRL